MISIVLFILIIGSLYIGSQGVKNLLTKKKNQKNMSIIISSFVVFFSSGLFLILANIN